MFLCCNVFDRRVFPRRLNVTVRSQFRPAESGHTCANLEPSPARRRSSGSQWPAFVIAWVVTKGMQIQETQYRKRNRGALGIEVRRASTDVQTQGNDESERDQNDYAARKY